MLSVSYTHLDVYKRQAWIPAKRATRVSAVEAVRSSQDIKISCKEVKVNRLNYVFFKLEGLLAKKYFKRDRKKYRATVVSLFMSVVLFISSSAYILYPVSYTHLARNR